MDPAVDQVLAERSRHGRGPAMASLGGALALHAAIAAALVILPRLSPPPPPLDYVDVKVVPAAALGAPRHEPREKAPPAPQPPPAEPPVTQTPVNRTPPKPAEAEPPKPAPAAPVLPQPPPRDTRPAKPEKPTPEKPKPPVPDKRVDPTTLPKVLPPPRELLAKRLGANDAKPPDAPPPANPALPNRPGSTTGSPAGTQAVGSSVATLDNPDFTYDYYIAQLLSSIDHNWTRPPVGNGVRAVVSFRIQRDGSIADLAVRESSSFDNFDLAALRAVQNAAPFPPLPRAYRHDSLGVNLIVR